MGENVRRNRAPATTGGFDQNEGGDRPQGIASRDIIPATVSFALVLPCEKEKRCLLYSP